MIRTILHRIIRILILAALLSVGILLLIASSSLEIWREMLIAFAGWRPPAIWAGLGCVVTGLLFALTGLKRRRKEKYLSFENEGGKVSVSTEAIADYVSKLVDEFPSVLRMRPTVVPRKNVIDIVVDLKIKAGPQIHEVCELVQKRVRESMTGGLGITEVRRVEVSVSKIVSQHLPKGE